MLSLKQVLADFLKVDRSAYTNQNYRRVLEKMVTAIGPERGIVLISYADLLNYTDHIKRGLEQSSFKQYVTVIKVFFTWAVKVRYLDWSPATQLTARTPPRKRLEERAVPSDILEAAMQLAYKDARDYAILAFIRGTAARVSGVASLRLSNLDLHNMQAWIYNKGGDWYWVYFGESTAAALARHLESRPTCDHDYVFTSRRGACGELKTYTYSAIVAKWTRMAGKVYRSHSIRHRTTQDWDEQGVGVSVLRDKLNHADLNTLNYYFARQNPQLRGVSRDMDKSHDDTPKSSKIIMLDDVG